MHDGAGVNGSSTDHIEESAGLYQGDIIQIQSDPSMVRSANYYNVFMTHSWMDVERKST